MTIDPIETLAVHMGIEVAFLKECLEHGALRMEELEENPAQLARLRRLHRLCLSLEIDAFAASIIVELLEELERR